MNQTNRSNDSELSAEDLASAQGGAVSTAHPAFPPGLLGILPFLRDPPLIFPKPRRKPSIWDIVRKNAAAVS